MDEEVKFEEDKKERKKINPKIIIYILIGVCVLLLIFLIVSMVNNSKLRNNNNIDLTDNEEKIEVLDITNEEVQKLFNTTTNTISNYCHKESSFFTESKVDIGTLSDEMVYGVIMNKIVNRDKRTGNISTRLIKEEINKLFGENSKFENVKLTTYPMYNYNEESATYIPNPNGKPFPQTVCDLYRVVKAYKTGNDFYIYARVLFVSNDNNQIKYYKDSRHSSEITDLVKNANGAVLANESNFAKGTLYEMKYTLDPNNNYVFNYSQPN